ncbi:MAG: hypothetical protein FJY29_01500 [Betaproteobacteria bacterium]|nr:hypothetical protein [Betaproteobacteria bacterium]
MLNWLILITVSLLVACGDADYSRAQGQETRNPASSNPSSKKKSQQPSEAPPCCDAVGAQPDPENAQVTPPPEVFVPVPVVGSYLAAFITDASGLALPNTEVVMEETGLQASSARTNSAGYVNLPVADPRKVERILVRRRTGTAVSESSLIIQATHFDALVRATYRIDAPNAVPQTLLEMRAGTNGSTLMLSNISNPANDKNPPRLGAINTAAVGGGESVTVNATDAESGLHPQAYSFDAGVTWVSSNRFVYPSGTSLPPGQIQVRDRAGNIAKTTFTLGL